MRTIQFGYDPKNDTVCVEQVTIEYSQPCDEKSDHWQRLTIEAVDSGAGAYLVLKTERWAIEDIQELIDTLEDFKRRAGI